MGQDSSVLEAGESGENPQPQADETVVVCDPCLGERWWVCFVQFPISSC